MRWLYGFAFNQETDERAASIDALTDIQFVSASHVALRIRFEFFPDRNKLGFNRYQGVPFPKYFLDEHQNKSNSLRNRSTFGWHLRWDFDKGVLGIFGKFTPRGIQKRVLAMWLSDSIARFRLFRHGRGPAKSGPSASNLQLRQQENNNLTTKRLLSPLISGSHGKSPRYKLVVS